MEHFVVLDNVGYLYLCWSECLGGGGWEMLVGKGDWRKGLYGPFGVCGTCMDRVLKDFFCYEIQ